MEVKKDDFSFEESLKYLDSIASQLHDGVEIPELHSMQAGDFMPNKVIKVFGTAMYIKVTNNMLGTNCFKSRQYAVNTVTNLILKILQTNKMLTHLNQQTDGSLLVVYDTPMKKDVEDMINLAGQVRSINEVAMKKFHLEMSDQTVSIGMDYGPIYTYSSGESFIGSICTGVPLKAAKVLAECKEDNVIISDDIYINLPEDLRKHLFQNEDVERNIKYHYSPLINLRMRKWVMEH